MLVANAIQLFMAGYETTSTILSVALYHLARDGSVQERAREEVDAVVEEESDEEEQYLGYHALQKLTYLEAVLQVLITKHKGEL